MITEDKINSIKEQLQEQLSELRYAYNALQKDVEWGNR